MERFWLSWCQPGDDYRPLTYPPNAAIVGWWNSGSSGNEWTLCALVSAANQTAAKKAVKADWPEAAGWRFCEEKPADWMPNDRFPLSDWMRERVAAIAAEAAKGE